MGGAGKRKRNDEDAGESEAMELQWVSAFFL